MTSAAVSIQRTESGMISPFVGFFIDKFGPRTVMLVGIFITGIGFILLSRIDSLWQFYASFVLITVGLSFGTYLVVTTAIANWFVAQRGRAFAIASTGSALGGLLVPAVIWMISITDWRTGLLIIGFGFWAMGVPVAMVMRRRPEDYGLLPDGKERSEDADAKVQPDEVPNPGGGPQSGASGATREVDFTVSDAMKTRSFWQMALAMGTGQMIVMASVHQIPAMTSFGLSRETAGIVLVGVSLASLVGRLVSGYLGDLTDKRRVIAVASTLQLIGTLIFAATGAAWHLIGFILFWGIGFGASIPIRFAMLGDYFGRRHFGSIMGMMFTISTVFGIVSPLFVGWMADLRGNYREPYLLLSLAALVTVPLVLSLTPPVQRRKVTA